jgi:hypothetical protein
MSAPLTDRHGRTFTPAGAPGELFYVQSRHRRTGRLLAVSLVLAGPAEAARAAALPGHPDTVRLVCDAAYPSPLPAHLPPGTLPRPAGGDHHGHR